MPQGQQYEWDGEVCNLRKIVVMFFIIILNCMLFSGCGILDDAVEDFEEDMERAQKNGDLGSEYNKGSDQTTEMDTEQKGYNIGDTVEVEYENGGRIEITPTEYGATSTILSNNAIYVIFQIENIGDQTVSVGNSLFNFYADDYSLDIIFDSDNIHGEPFTGAELSTGRKVNGTVYVEVNPDNVTRLEMEVADAIYVLKNDNTSETDISVDSDEEDLSQPISEEIVPEEDNIYSSVNDIYIIEDSDKRYVTEEEVASLSPEEVRLAKNEIYARHGRIFDSEDLREYFESQSWYHGEIEPEDFDEGVLNEYERANIDLLVSYE